MDPSIHRILDANSNRAREALRVLEEHARLILDDAALTERTKQLRHDLAAALAHFGPAQLLAERDIQNDVGTRISTDLERARNGPTDVAVAAAKRASEALRCLEEYGKIVSPDAAARIEHLRYRLYALEKDIVIGGPRRQKLRTARLHVLITQSNCTRPWMDVCEQAIAGGADVIQLREKALSDRELLQRAQELRDLTAKHGILLIINDRADIARLADADGVHLGRCDLPVPSARHLLGPNRLIGVTAHSLAEAQAALTQSPDYLALGPMFPSPTKPNVPVQGPRLLADVAPISSVPIVAIGGITPNNVAKVSDLFPQASSLKPQAFAIAVCQFIIASADPAGAVRALLTEIRAPRPVP